MQKREKKRGKRMEQGRAWIELDREALRNNVDVLRARLPKSCRLMPAVKANAYGHGDVLIAKELNRLGIDAFCVACVSEGVKLRLAGVKGEILILGYTPLEQFFMLKRYDLTQTVVDYSYAVELNGYGERLPVHIGVDTGMHRLGERSENLDHICDMFAMDNLIVDGLFTHLCAADTKKPSDRAFTEAQAKAFYRVAEEIEQRGWARPRLHLLSSYGIFNYPEYAADCARPGIALYGVLSTKADTDSWGKKLCPVLSLKARVAAVRTLREGEFAGYGRQFVARGKTRIATIAIGYADGLPRRLSNGAGEVLIHGRRAPVAGRICMDQTIVDVSHIPEVKAGDVAVVIGRSGAEEISACELAERTGTITNEILSGLGERLCRMTVCPKQQEEGFSWPFLHSSL